MIAPLRQMTELSNYVSFRLNLTILSFAAGFAFGGIFSLIWPNLMGMAALALWSLGLGLSFGLTALISNRRQGILRWDLLFIAQLFGIMGAILFLAASIA